MNKKGCQFSNNKAEAEDIKSRLSWNNNALKSCYQSLQPSKSFRQGQILFPLAGSSPPRSKAKLASQVKDNLDNI